MTARTADTPTTIIADNPVQQTRIILARTLLIFLLVSTLVLVILNVLSTGQLVASDGISLAFAAVFGGFIYYINRPNLTNIIISLTLAYITSLSFTVAATDSILIAMFGLAVVSAALLGSRLTYYLVFAVIGLRLIFHVTGVMTTVESAGGMNAENAIGGLVLGAIPLLFGVLIRYFTQVLESTVTSANRNAQLLEASAIIGQEITGMFNADDLLQHAVRVIRDRFGYYHVQIFLVNDQGTYANLQVGTGIIGQQMRERGHRVAIDSRSLIGRVILTGEPLTTNNAQSDRDNIINEMLPYTNAELAVPIKDGDIVIGVLDVQSVRTGLMSRTEIQALEVMAAQLGTATRNARLFAEQERSMREQQRLFIEAETNLREIERLNRQLTGQAWDEHLHGGSNVTGVTLGDNRFEPANDWSDRMIEASKRRRPVRDRQDDKTIISVPVELRNEVIGAIEVETGQNDEYTAELLEAVANRLAISLDNARLFEDAQASSAQEQRVSEIVTQFQSVTSIEELLQITLEGVFQTLGAERGSIRLRQIPVAGVDVVDVSAENGHTQNGGTSA